MEKKTLKEHRNGLKNHDPRTSTESMAFTYLTTHRINHTTSELGIFMGGMYSAFALVESFLNAGNKFPTFNQVNELEDIKDLSFLKIYSWALFQEYNYWRTKQEIFQSKKGIGLTNLFAKAVHESYKEFQKWNKEKNEKQQR